MLRRRAVAPEPDDSIGDAGEPRRARIAARIVTPIAVLVAILAIGAAVLGRDGRSRAGGDAGSGEPPAATPVRAAAVERGDLALFAGYPGELVGEAADLAPRIAGRLETVAVRPGERVARGAVVAVIDDAELRRQLEEAQGQLGVAEANRDRAAAAAEEARADLARGRELFAAELISEQEHERLEARAATVEAELAGARAQVEQARARAGVLEERLADTRVRAPFSGTVGERYLDAGAQVQAGTPVVRLVEAGSLLVQFRVPERDLGKVAPGAPLAVRTQATGDRAFRGRVARVSGEVSRTDRTALVEGVIEEGAPALRPGMYAEVEVRLEEIEDALLVPGAALVERVDPAGAEIAGVFAAADGAEPRARWLPVAILGRSADRVAVEADGLSAGDRVLTLGHEELADGARIKVVEAPR